MNVYVTMYNYMMSCDILSTNANIRNATLQIQPRNLYFKFCHIDALSHSMKTE